ncbi:MAG TPA: transposase, partial [Acidiphilium sp.]|nr:transposase [Acidiphilium sp.]
SYERLLPAPAGGSDRMVTNTTEMIRMMDVLLKRYADRRTLYLSWDAASWHVSKKLVQRIKEHHATAETSGRPRVEMAPLPAGAQFLNVIESVFSGMARAIIHNSNYPSVDAARAAIDLYFADRNQQFRANNHTTLANLPSIPARAPSSATALSAFFLIIFAIPAQCDQSPQDGSQISWLISPPPPWSAK